MTDSKTSRGGLPVAFFDADDTLWSTNVLYDGALTMIERYLGVLGLDSKRFLVLQGEENVKLAHAWGRTRNCFPESCRRAYLRLANEAGRPESEYFGNEIRTAAESVFSGRSITRRHAFDVLEQLSETHFLVMLTEGDFGVQQSRIEHSRMGGLFDAIEIVDRKTPTLLRAMMDKYGADSATAWVIGNSLTSDILPALECDLNAVLIESIRTLCEVPTEHPKHPKFHIARDLSELPQLMLGQEMVAKPYTPSWETL